jgi:hypothetical protein
MTDVQEQHTVEDPHGGNDQEGEPDPGTSPFVEPAVEEVERGLDPWTTETELEKRGT